MAWAAGTLALAEAASKSSSTTLTTGTGAAATAVGDVILVAVAGITQSTGITQVTDTAGNTYTNLTPTDGLDLGISRFALFGTVVTTATTTSTTWTATWAAAVSTRVMAASSFTGGSINIRASTLASVEGTANTNMSVGPTGASATAGDLVWAQFVSTNATDTWTFTPTGAWLFANDATTGNSGTNRSIGTEYQVAPSTTTYTGTATQSGSRAYDGIILALEVAGPVQKVSSDSGVGTDATSAASAAITSAESGSGADASQSAQAAASGQDAAVGADATVSLVETIPSPSDLGGGGDAWAGRADRPYARLEPAPAPRAPAEPKPRHRISAADLVPEPAPVRPVRITEPALPRVDLEAQFVSATRAIGSSDGGGAVDATVDLVATWRGRPPRVPWEEQVEELELLLVL